MPALHQIREIHRFLAKLGGSRGSFKRASELSGLAEETMRWKETNPWAQFLDRLLESWREESGDAELPVQEVLEFLYEGCAESRREFKYGEGVTLNTVHSAKGTEFEHVMLIGPWQLPTKRVLQEEERRAFYVGLTRARKTLAVVDRIDVRPSLPETLAGRGVFRSEFAGVLTRQETNFLNYSILALEDIHLGYPGQFAVDHPIHAALAALQPGHNLTMRAAEGNGIGLFDQAGVCVARLSRKAGVYWSEHRTAVQEVRVLAMVCRKAGQDADQARRERYQVPEWEVPVVEVVCEEKSAD